VEQRSYTESVRCTATDRPSRITSEVQGGWNRPEIKITYHRLKNCKSEAARSNDKLSFQLKDSNSHYIYN